MPTAGLLALGTLTVTVLGILGGAFVAAFSRTPAARVDIVGDHVRIEMQGLLSLYALRGHLDLPLPAIGAVRTDHAARKLVGGIRFGGTELPRLLYAGTFLRRRGRDFVAVRRSGEALVLELRTKVKRYTRVIVEVDDPAAAAAAIEAAR